MKQIFAGLILAVIAASSLAPDVEAQGCGARQVRKEIHDLSAAERNDYFSAIRSMQSGRRPTEYDTISQIHYNARDTAHGWPWFFPWHRAYLDDFQKRLRKFKPNLVIPYWDWSLESQAPELSAIWGADWYGGNGASGSGCVTNGRFSQWQPAYPSPHCLRRTWDNGNTISAYYSPQALQSIIRSSTTFDQYRQRIESVPHGQVHVSIGQDMVTMYSPNDPVFFLHHAFIDKLWADWQASGQGRDQAYNGRNPNGSNVRTSDILVPFNRTVASVLRTTDLCYTYAPRNARGTGTVAPGPNQANNFRSLLAADSVAPSQNGNATANAAPVTDVSDSTPAPDDRTELVALRSSKPVPESWLQANHHDVQQARNTESLLLDATKKFNADGKTISPAALINDQDTLKKLPKPANGRAFTCTNAGKRVTVKVAQDQDLVSAIKKVSTSVAKVLNNAVVANAASASS